MTKNPFSGWVILGALAFAAVLIGLAVLAVYALPPAGGQAAGEASALLTVIPAPTSTPPGMNNLFFTPTPTINPLIASGQTGGIAPGVYVQITGTEGEGLRIRTAPGTANDVKFLALDAEVFKVFEGPQDADGYLWWYLEAPYDQTRNGWAAANFLRVVETQP
jgi:hypothetical protein